MKNEILIDNITFWVDQNIIYCKIQNDFKEKEIDIEEIFFYAISELSEDKYRPILVNIEEVGFFLSIKVFKFLSKSSLIKKLVLTKTFLVSSFMLKGFLYIYNFINNPIIPDAIFMNQDLAINDCNKKYMMFNALS